MTCRQLHEFLGALPDCMAEVPIYIHGRPPISLLRVIVIIPPGLGADDDARIELRHGLPERAAESAEETTRRRQV